MVERFEQPHLDGMSRRQMLEAQAPAVLIALKGEMLDKLSDLESDVHLINDVLLGYGLYDANDGTPGAAEHPEDDIWPDNVIPGEN